MQTSFKSPAEVVQKLNELAPNIGLGYSERKRLVNSWNFVIGLFCIDICAFGEWIEEKYPMYKDCSIDQFIKDKDPEHIEDWKLLLGVYSE